MEIYEHEMLKLLTQCYLLVALYVNSLYIYASLLEANTNCMNSV